MKKPFLLLISLIVSIVAMGGPLTPDEARQNVAKFMNPRRAAAVIQHPEALRLVSTSHYKVQENTLAPSYYIFNVGKGEGYVIAAADDRVPAVLGYSNRGQINPDEMPENMKSWLQGYNDQLEYLNRHPETPIARRTVTGDAIAPLLGPITWDQKSPYNDLCPMDGDVHSLTGCVATAMAQIMYFWKYPNATIDIIPGYTTITREYQMPDIAAGTTIDWDNILPKYTGYETDAQKEAVATLMLLCGAAMKMNYSNSFSGAYGYDASLAARKYFDYDDATIYRYRKDFFEADWNQMVYDELKAGRPLYYDGSSSDAGHAFVVDGYGGDDYFHVNWGWGGSSNDYFLLSILDSKNNSGSGATKSADGYSFGQGAIFGMQPKTGIPTSKAYRLTTDEAAFFCDTVMIRKNIDEDFVIEAGFSQINNWDDTYTFDLGEACVDAYGQALRLSYGTTVELPATWGYLRASSASMKIRFGAGIDDLDFFIIPISRISGTDEWYPSYGAETYYITANIKGNTLRLSAPVFGLTGSLATTGKKEEKAPIPMKATVTNNGSVWKGEIFFLLNGEMKGGRHIDFKPCETKDIDFSITPDSVGKYEVAVATRTIVNGQTIYTSFITDSITIDPASIANLDIKYDVTNAINYIVKESTLKLLVTATNNGTNTYENQIVAEIYKDSHNGYFTNTITLKQDTKIGIGETVQLPFDFVNLEDDNYIFIIKYLSKGEWTGVQTKSFKVQTREPDPAPVLSTMAQTANAVKENDSWIVKSDTALVSVQVKNVGTIDYNDNIIVKLYKLTTATGGPHVGNYKTPIQLAAGADTTVVVQIPGLEDGATYFYWTYYIANKDEQAGSQVTPLFTVILDKPAPEETGYYLISDMNSWSTTDQSYPFTKLDDGKTWEITFNAPKENGLWLKVAPASAYDDQAGFWTHLFCAPYNGCSEFSGTMIIGDEGAWLLPATLKAETYTMSIVPSEMTYTITHTEQSEGIQLVNGDRQGIVTIYGLNGNKIAESNAADLQRQLKSLPKGLYIVRSGKQSAKVRN